jgi:hypothetical protein
MKFQYALCAIPIVLIVGVGCNNNSAPTAIPTLLGDPAVCFRIYVWQDNNANGGVDPGEPRMSDIHFNVTYGTERYPNGRVTEIVNDLTDKFYNSYFGETHYRLKIAAPEGFHLTTPDETVGDMGDGDCRTAYFGLAR